MDSVPDMYRATRQLKRGCLARILANHRISYYVADEAASYSTTISVVQL